jgi:serine/threonine protein kinase/CheY-like chemotaxis protein
LLVEKLGQGSAGVVFRALHQSLNIQVAVKVLHPAHLEDDRRVHRQLQSEARLLAQLNHPSIVRVWDFEDHPVYPYLVLEHIEGLTLGELIEQSGRLRPDRALPCIIQVAEGLAAALRLGIIHRDVKPGNILLAKSGIAKLADLGLAIYSVEEAASGGPALRGLVGTPAYMSPEHFTSPKAVDHRSDIYSLGATFYHALTGRMPYPGRSFMEILLMHARERVVPPHEVIPEVDPAFSTVILRMMHKEPLRRYQCYADLLADLKLLREQSSNQTRDTLGSIGRSTLDLEPRPRPTFPSTATGAETEATNHQVVSAPPLMSSASSTALAEEPGSQPSPQSLQQLLQAGIAAAKAGDKPRARRIFLELTHQDPKNETAWLWLAGVAQSPAETVQFLRRVLDINPTSQQALAGLRSARLQVGANLVKEGNKSEARRYLVGLTEEDPGSELAWYMRVGVAESPQEAVDCLEKVIALNPTNGRAWEALGWYRSQLATGQTGWQCPLCGTHAAQPADVCPGCGSVLNLARVESLLNSPPVDGERLRERMLQYQIRLRDTPDFLAHYNLGLAYLNLKKFDEALGNFQAACRLRPDNNELRGQVGALLRARAKTAQDSQQLTPIEYRGTVVVIDDSATVRKAVSLTLEKRELRVVTAVDGSEGLKRVREMLPDFVLLDIAMPGIDGYQVCRALKSDPTTRDIPVIMLSGKDGFFDKIRGRIAGSMKYITKPFRPDLLVQLAEKLCSARKRSAAH